jgi:hypothetical protein
VEETLTTVQTPELEEVRGDIQNVLELDNQDSQIRRYGVDITPDEITESLIGNQDEETTDLPEQSTIYGTESPATTTELPSTSTSASSTSGTTPRQRSSTSFPWETDTKYRFLTYPCNHGRLNFQNNIFENVNNPFGFLFENPRTLQPNNNDWLMTPHHREPQWNSRRHENPHSLQLDNNDWLRPRHRQQLWSPRRLINDRGMSPMQLSYPRQQGRIFWFRTPPALLTTTTPAPTPLPAVTTEPNTMEALAPWLSATPVDERVPSFLSVDDDNLQQLESSINIDDIPVTTPESKLTQARTATNDNWLTSQKDINPIESSSFQRDVMSPSETDILLARLLLSKLFFGDTGVPAINNEPTISTFDDNESKDNTLAASYPDLIMKPQRNNELLGFDQYEARREQPWPLDFSNHARAQRREKFNPIFDDADD